MILASSQSIINQVKLTVTVFVTAFAFLLFSTIPAWGQESALKGHDTQQPIDVTAENLEVRSKEGWALFSGFVEVLQGGLTMKAAEMRVFYDKETVEDNPQIIRLDAKGKVTFTSSSEKIVANRAVYDVEKRLVTMLGDITMTRGKSVLTGDRLELNLVTGLSKLYGAKGEQKKGRVRGTFSLPKNEKDK